MGQQKCGANTIINVTFLSDKFLNDFSKKSVDAEGRSNEHAFRNRWRRHFSILLQKCNSSIILKRLQDCHVGG